MLQSHETRYREDFLDQTCGTCAQAAVWRAHGHEPLLMCGRAVELKLGDVRGGYKRVVDEHGSCDQYRPEDMQFIVDHRIDWKTLAKQLELPDFLLNDAQQLSKQMVMGMAYTFQSKGYTVPHMPRIYIESETS